MLTIKGYSDDLVSLGGDIAEEWTYVDSEGRGDLIATSNGCLFRIIYDAEGCWRITPIVVPAGVAWSKVEAVGWDDDIYSDTVTIEGVTWVAHADTHAVAS